MTHAHLNHATLNQRIGSVPLADLADCTDVSHHAIGSPHFNSLGEALGLDPLITLLAGDLLDPRLPHATALFLPSPVRPLLTTDPLLRRVITAADPDLHLTLKGELEGRVTLGETKQLNPGALISSISTLTLIYCESTRPESFKAFAEGVAEAIRALPSGATARISIPQFDDLELELRALTHLIDAITPALTAGLNQRAPRRVLLISPELKQAQAVLAVLIGRALKLSLIDRLTEAPLTPGLSYGVSSLPELELITARRFIYTLTRLDETLDLIILREPKRALLQARGLLDSPESAQDINHDEDFERLEDQERLESSSTLSALYVEIHKLTQHEYAVSYALADELTRRISWGVSAETFELAQTIAHPTLCEEARRFARQVMTCITTYHEAERLALITDEKYTQARDHFRQVEIPLLRLLDAQRSLTCRLDSVERAITTHELIDTVRSIYDLVLSSLDASPELTRGTQAFERIRTSTQYTLELNIGHLEQLCKRAGALEDLQLAELTRTWIEEWIIASQLEYQPARSSSSIPQVVARTALIYRRRSSKRLAHHLVFARARLESLLERIPLEISSILKPRCDLLSARARLAIPSLPLTLHEQRDLWSLLFNTFKHTAKESHERHAALAYLILIALTRGRRLISRALLLIRLWSRLLEKELKIGVYGERTLITHRDAGVIVPLKHPTALQARAELERWNHFAQQLFAFTQGLARADLSYDLACDRQRRLLESLRGLGRERLALAYQHQLDAEWLSRFITRDSSPLKAALTSVLGETLSSVLLMFWRLIKVLRYSSWRLFSRDAEREITELIHEALTEIERQLTGDVNDADETST